MNINELRKAKLEAVEQAQAIQAGAAAGERELTEDEAGKIDELLDQAGGYEAQAAELEKAEVRQTRLIAAVQDVNAPRPPAVELGQPSQPGADVVVGRDLWEDDPTRGFATYNDFCTSVRMAYRPGGAGVDDRLLRIQSAAQGANLESGAEAGFLSPPEYTNRIYARAMEILPILAQCDKLTLKGNSVTVNASVDYDRSGTTQRYGGIVVYYVAEAGQITRSSLKFHQVNLKLNKVAALAYATEEELADVANYGARLLDKMAIGIADTMVEGVMFGTGVGQPLGAFKCDACISTVKETGQAADTIIFLNIIAMSANVWAPSAGKVNWYYNQECLPQLRTMVIEIGAGGVPLWLPGNIVAGAPSTLDGRPIFATDHCEKLGDAGDIVLGDFSQYLLATKGTVQTAISIHLRFDYDETAFKSTFRYDGRPAWLRSLKPRKGATAKRVSPFVKLAVRA